MDRNNTMQTFLIFALFALLLGIIVYGLSEHELTAAEVFTPIMQQIVTITSYFFGAKAGATIPSQGSEDLEAKLAALDIKFEKVLASMETIEKNKSG